MSACADIPFVQAAQAEDQACATPPSRNVHREIWRDGSHGSGERLVPEETPVAVVYDGSTYAVMMATPEDLEDFAIGFSLTEGVVRSATEIRSIDLVRSRHGIELQMWLAGSNSQRLGERRRRIAGPTGCGLCGIESLAESIRPAKIVGDGRKFTAAADHRCDAKHSAASKTEHRDTRGSCCGFLAIWPRRRRVTGRRRSP